MKKILIVMIILLMTGCTNKEEKTFEDCVIQYEEGSTYCTQDEFIESFTNIVIDSNLLEDEYSFTSVIMLDEDTIYVNGYTEIAFDKELLEEWQLVLQHIDRSVGIGNYRIEVVIQDRFNNYIFSLYKDELIGIIVLGYLQDDLSANDILVLSEFLETDGFSEKRIRYGQLITGDDIYVEDNEFIIPSDQFNDLNFLAEELVKAFDNYLITVE